MSRFLVFRAAISATTLAGRLRGAADGEKSHHHQGRENFHASSLKGLWYFMTHRPLAQGGQKKYVLKSD
jgi:hypothetical protein